MAVVGLGAVLGCSSSDRANDGGTGTGGRAGGSGGMINGSGGASNGSGGMNLGTGGTTGGTGGSGGSGGMNAGSGGTSGSGGLIDGSGGASGSAGATGGTGGKIGGSGGAGGCGAGGALAATSFGVRFANAVMSRWPDPINIAGGSNAWEYNHGIVLRGMQQVWKHTCDARYVTYIQKYADEFVDAGGTVNIPAAHSFDNIQPSVLLPFLYQQTGQAKYHTAADNIRARYDTIPTNPDGGFWHKQTYPNQMWLDSIYMGQPFLDQYAAVFGTCGTYCSTTIFQQTLLIADHVRDATTGLLYHAWDDSPAGQKAAWADPTTGRSSVIWDRALGWYAMALVDMLSDLPAGDDANSLLSILRGIAVALQTTQDPATGLWFEVVDQGSRSDDWVETSGSGMFVYALKMAVNQGYIDSSYLTVASRGWQGLQGKITTDANGLPTITDAVQGLSVQSNYAGYVNQATVSNSSQGLCGVLLAASEMEAQ